MLARSTNNNKWRLVTMQAYKPGQASLNSLLQASLPLLLELTIIQCIDISKVYKATMPSKESFLG